MINIVIIPATSTRIKKKQLVPVTATFCPSWYQLILAPCAARTLTVSSISLWRLMSWFSGGTMISGGWCRWWRWVATVACSSTDSCLDTRLALTSRTCVLPLAVFCSTMASLKKVPFRLIHWMYKIMVYVLLGNCLSTWRRMHENPFYPGFPCLRCVTPLLPW